VNDLRLTRRGRLLVQTFPLFLLVTVATQALVHRAGHLSANAALVPAPQAFDDVREADAADAARRPAAASPPAVRPTTTTAPPSRPAVRPPNGPLVVVPGRSAVHGAGRLRRFSVEVEAGLPDDPAAFAAAVEAVLFDARGWRGEGFAFQRVSSGPVSFRVTLAGPATTNRLCAPLDTGGIYSCHQSGRSVLNAMRWHGGAAAYPGDLAAYRIYVVNHEVGHALGHGHRYRCGDDGYAPVMMQQTKSLYGCRPNPWPLEDER
jgi:hypothetical protein